ncbi:MAG: SIMPL domain-containing protein [Betaproteobacteria bacterium]
MKTLNFVLALAAAATGLAANAQAPEPRFNQVELQAEASREVQNDLMTANLYAEASDPSAAKVADQLNRATAEALKLAGSEKAVKARSGYSQTYPVNDRNGKVTGWRGRSEVRLESKDTKAMAALIARLQASMQLSGVSFSVSPDLRRQTENDLINEAVAAFKARADIAAKAIGGRAYKIRRIGLNTGGMQASPRPMLARGMAAQSAEVSTPVFEAGTSVVNVVAAGTVEVE